MKREFLVDEVILDSVSGEIRGTVDVDPYSGSIDRIECQSFRFWRDDTGLPLMLSQPQRELACNVVEQLLESDGELGEISTPWYASAEAASRQLPLSASKQTLAAILESPSRSEPESVQQRHAQ